MHMRVVLRTPGGETVTRDTLDGRWAEPWGVPDETTSPDMWALPGLVDAHAHLARSVMGFGLADVEETGARAREALEAGVGLVLDKGWVDLTVIEMIDRVPPSERPDIEAAGVILQSKAGTGRAWAGTWSPAAQGMR